MTKTLDNSELLDSMEKSDYKNLLLYLLYKGKISPSDIRKWKQTNLGIIDE